MAEFVRHVFGPEGAAYVERYLEANRDYESHLAKGHCGAALLRHHDIATGVVWSLIPDTARPDRVTRFEYGGVFEGSGLWAQPAVKPWLDGLLAAPRAMVLAESILGSRTDGYYRDHPEDPVVFCNDAAYDYADATEADRALSLFGGDIRWRPDVAFVTSTDALAPGQLLSLDELDTLAAAARAIVIGAWDDGGIICWEPAPSE